VLAIIVIPPWAESLGRRGVIVAVLHTVLSLFTVVTVTFVLVVAILELRLLGWACCRSVETTLGDRHS
jgi:hypothetical protein